MAKTITIEGLNIDGIKDVIANLKDALYWTNRVAVDPAQVDLPYDEYNHPEQASLAITQGIMLLTELIYETKNNKEN